ncbi:MAG: PilZ domain-containing protein [Candidatus Thiodiazotropha sp.]|jgi:hypothetical protein
MEHRYYPRVKVSLKVDLFKRDKLIGRAFTKDVSLGGMLIQNNCLALSRNDVITLKVWLDGVEQVVRCLVVHTSLHSIGVMLIDMSTDVKYEIFNYLKGKEVPLRDALRELDYAHKL